MVRVLRIAAGFLLLIVGAVLAVPGIPGPGILIALLGLALLSRHFTWAEKAIGWVKRKTARLSKGPQ
jgi:hypothetical protein